MEVKIGIRQVAKEIVIESQLGADEITAQLAEALSNEGVLDLVDPHGRHVLIPAAGIGYIELGTEHSRPVGFGAI